MVAVRVDGPVRENHIRFLAFDDILHLRVPFLGDFGVSIHLIHKYVAYAHNATCFGAFAMAYGRSLRGILPAYTGFAAGEVYADNFASETLEYQHRAAGNSFRVIRVCPDHERLLILASCDILSSSRDCRNDN